MADALLVDDDVSFQAALAELVRAEGFSVETAASLDEARTYLREHTPDLALVDLRLPDGSGLELLREIDSQVATEIVLITGNATVDSAVEALRSGASDYLTKPVDIPRLNRCWRTSSAGESSGGGSKRCAAPSAPPVTSDP